MDTRLKLRYTESETQLNLYTFGEEWSTEDGVEYRGLYHRYLTTDETYTGGTHTATSKRLIAFNTSPESVKQYRKLTTTTTTYTVPTTAPVTITMQDRTAGYVMRYFAKPVNSTNIIEIAPATYAAYQARQIDPNMYVATSIKWYIAGNIETTSTPYKQLGVAELNQQQVAQAERILPGISKKLQNFTEYYTDTDFIVPKNIN